MAMAWGDFVTDAEKLQIAKWTGKMPLLFIHPKMLWIEEVAWSFLGIGDAYPTLPLALMGNNQRIDLVSDFDTGATGIFTGCGDVGQERCHPNLAH